MVIDSNALDRVFAALSDATRRGMMAQLSKGDANVSQLAEPYAMSQPAISKHLKILENAGLIERTKIGRETWVRARPEKAEEAAEWIKHYATFWQQRFDAVDHILNKRRSDPDDKDIL
ncbi:MAG: metalloregulator ArsR/SmtB family transcription factor [Pseudomonadota bacterium]